MKNPFSTSPESITPVTQSVETAHEDRGGIMLDTSLRVIGALGTVGFGIMIADGVASGDTKQAVMGGIMGFNSILLTAKGEDIFYVFD